MRHRPRATDTETAVPAGRPPSRRVLALLFVVAAFLPGPVAAGGPPPGAAILAELFPGAERAGDYAGAPPAAPVYKDGQVAGYVFSTWDTTGSVGYAGNPIDILVGVDAKGVITGARLHRHSEPILVIGIAEERLAAYVSGFRGIDIRTRVSGAAAERTVFPPIIAGASVSSVVIREAVIRATRTVARSRGLIGAGEAEARLDQETFAEATWAELLADGSIVRLRLTRGAVHAALGQVTATGGTDPEDLFIDLHAGLVTPPRVGQNLLGKRAFTAITSGLGFGDQAIVVAANGLYSFKGTNWVRSGRFDRIELVQGNRTIGLVKVGYRNVERLGIAGAPKFREIAVFQVPKETGFEPLLPWRLQLSVTRQTSAGNAVGAAFELDYRLPARYRVGDSPAPEAAASALPWRQTWRDGAGRVAVLLAMLVVLTVILVFQDAVVRNRFRYRAIRLTFLTVTLVWLGWYAGGQLSVVNVLTFVHSLMGDFHWEFFLLDPLAFILWSYVAVTLLFWARGVFCGWLCPFGALQELLNEIARKFGVRQIQVPFALHERMWTVKYIVFLGLFALSLHSTNLAIVGAEVEPFKTAISLKFVRDWPFTAYALALLGAGLFVERFFCRYLCPLGAALAIPARLRMFDWLKRRFECGAQCGICAERCTVQAIHPTGAINPNECIHCLDCQAIYIDDATCPPLVARRKRRDDRRRTAHVPVPRGGGTSHA